MANASAGMTAVRFQMVLVTGHILEKSVTIGAFRRGTVRGTGGVGQTKRATMRASSTMIFDVGISFVAIITVVLILGHGRHRKDGIVMLIVV
jgi:hypothetical protein